MIIKINNDYQVDAQKYNNWTLQRITDASGKVVTDKHNNPVFKVIGYYPDLSSALIAYSKQKIIDDNEALTLDNYLIQLEVVKQELSEVLVRFDAKGVNHD